MSKKIFLILSLFIFVFYFLSYKDLFAYAQNIRSVSECVVVKVGSPSAEPDISKCKTSGQQIFTGSIQEKVIQVARTQISKMYCYGGPSALGTTCRPGSVLNPLGRDFSKYPLPEGAPNYDCSFLAGWTWYWATDGKFTMRGQTSLDWHDKTGKYQKFGPSEFDKLQPGDLIYFGDILRDSVHHVAIYSGTVDGKKMYIDAPGTYKFVQEILWTRKDAIGFLRPILK